MFKPSDYCSLAILHPLKFPDLSYNLSSGETFSLQARLEKCLAKAFWEFVWFKVEFHLPPHFSSIYFAVASSSLPIFWI